MDVYRIYGLIDPITLKIRYIGVTTRQLNARLSQHIHDAVKRNVQTHKGYWIRKLILKNKKPLIQLIEQSDKTNWARREKYWIKYYKNLTNTQEGGKCVVLNRTSESKERSRKSKYIPIVQLTKDGKVIRKWEAASEAATSLGILCSAIGNCLNKRVVLAGGFRWVYEQEFNSPSFSLRKRIPAFGSKPGFFIDSKTGKRTDFPNIQEAANITAVPHYSIRRAIKAHKEINGYLFYLV